MEKLRIVLYEYIEVYGLESIEVLELSKKLDLIISRVQKDINKYEKEYIK